MTALSASQRRWWVDVLFGALAVVAGLGLALLTHLASSPFLVIAFAGGLFVVALLFWRGEWGLALLCFITYTRLSDVAIRHHGVPSIAQPFILLLAVTIIVRWTVQGERPGRWERPMVVLGLYGLVSMISLLNAVDFSLGLNTLIDYAKDALQVVVIVLLLRRMASLRYAIWSLLAAGLLLGTITAFQYLTGTFTNDYAGFGQAAIQNIVGETNEYRIGGPIGDPNYYAQILVALVPLGLDRLWNERRWHLRALAGAAVTACVLSIVFTFSRGGFIALVVAGGLMLLRRRMHPAMLLATLALVTGLWQFIPPLYLERLSTITNILPGFGNAPVYETSLRGRTSEVTVAWMVFVDHPVIGVGPGNYPTHYLDYSRMLGIDSRREARSAHDLYLEIAAETGLVGLLAFILILGVALVGLWRGARRLQQAGRTGDAGMLTAVSAGLVGYLVAAIFLHGAYPRFMWLLVGLALGAPQAADEELAVRQA